MTIFWRSEDNERECIANATLVTICNKISSKTLVIPRSWIRKEVVFYCVEVGAVDVTVLNETAMSAVA